MCDCLGPLLLPPHPCPPCWVFFSHRKHGGGEDSLRICLSEALGEGESELRRLGGEDKAQHGHQRELMKLLRVPGWRPPRVLAAFCMPSPQPWGSLCMDGNWTRPAASHKPHAPPGNEREGQAPPFVCYRRMRTVSLVKLGQWAALAWQICDLSEGRKLFTS